MWRPAFGNGAEPEVWVYLVGGSWMYLDLRPVVHGVERADDEGGLPGHRIRLNPLA